MPLKKTVFDLTPVPDQIGPLLSPKALELVQLQGDPKSLVFTGKGYISQDGLYELMVMGIKTTRSGLNTALLHMAAELNALAADNCWQSTMSEPAVMDMPISMISAPEICLTCQIMVPVAKQDYIDSVVKSRFKEDLKLFSLS